MVSDLLSEESLVDALSRVVGLQLELSMVPLYDGQPLIDDLIGSVRTMGFVLMSLEPDFYDQSTGQLLQADGIFFRPGDPEALESGERPGGPGIGAPALHALAASGKRSSSAAGDTAAGPV